MSQFYFNHGLEKGWSENVQSEIFPYRNVKLSSVVLTLIGLRKRDRVYPHLVVYFARWVSSELVWWVSYSQNIFSELTFSGIGTSSSVPAGAWIASNVSSRKQWQRSSYVTNASFSLSKSSETIFKLCCIQDLCSSRTLSFSSSASSSRFKTTSLSEISRVLQPGPAPL